MDLAAEYTNPKGMNMVISAMNTKTEEMTTLCTNETMGSCSGKALNYDDGATVTVNLTLPDAADANDLLATPNPPVNYRVWICYSAPDIAKRKWRKFDDTIKVCTMAALGLLWLFQNKEREKDCHESGCACLRIDGHCVAAAVYSWHSLRKVQCHMRVASAHLAALCSSALSDI